MRENITPQWLNKKQVCQWLGGVDYTTLDYYIEKDNFPNGFKSQIVANKKWYLPSIEKWAEQNCG